MRGIKSYNRLVETKSNLTGGHLLFIVAGPFNKNVIIFIIFCMIVKRTNLKNMYLILQGQENSLAVQHALQCWPFWIFCTEFEIWLLLYSKRMSSGSRVELLWQQTTSLSFQVKKCACIFQMVLIFHRIQSLLRTKCHSRNRTGLVQLSYIAVSYWVM